MTQDDTSDFVSEKAAARMLQLSVRTLQRYRTAGTGPRWSRIGPCLVRYLRSDIKAWLEAAKQ